MLHGQNPLASPARALAVVSYTSKCRLELPRMTRPSFVASAFLTALVVAAPLAAQQPGASAPAEPVRSGYTAGDVQFMTGMIAHHAQAVLIAGWAPTHGASASMRALC
jgi:uncharacterized protein (DUF305 family)